MKKVSISLLFVLAGLTTYAQFSKGTIMAGGNFRAAFNTEKSKTGSTSTTTGTENTVLFNPQVGYFFVDNFAAGAGIGVSSDSYKQKGTDYSSLSTAFTFTPFARYYYQKFYGQLTYLVGSSKDKTSSGGTSTESKTNYNQWSLAVGYAILLNEHVAIEPQIGYQSTAQKADGSDTKTIDQGLFIQVGFQIYLHK